MRHHELKTWPGPFAKAKAGLKTYEIRVNDRGFSEGDSVRLNEWDPTDNRGATGASLDFTIGHVTEGGRWGLPPDLCVFSLLPSRAP